LGSTTVSSTNGINGTGIGISNEHASEGSPSLPTLLKERMQQRRSEDPQGIARSVSELRERLEIQEANITKNINKFSEIFTKELS
jgi:hypothetical protein